MVVQVTKNVYFGHCVALKMKKGDTTALVYVRDGEEVETEITF